MAKRLARRLCSASVPLTTLTAALLFGPVQAQAISSLRTAPILLQGDLEKPQNVIDWLKANEAKADKATARKLFDQGTRHKQRKDWDGAIKGFGGSAGFYPAPRTFIELAEAELQMLRNTRHSTGTTNADRLGDLKAAANSYGHALAADSVLKQLTPKQRQDLEFNIACTTEYLKTQLTARHCPPLVLYGIAK